jgi:photosystem II stability/assembly factor-like uncharacterized protein
MPSYTWQRKGLDGESLRDIALLPGGNNLVLASSPGGVWRDQYDYTTWDKVSVPLQDSDPPPGIVALTIGSPDVMYVAAHTGCASGLPMNSFRSTDGGQTWTPMQPEIVAINASNGGVAYAALCTGIIKTTDSGATWSDVLPGSHNENRDPYGVVSSPDGEQVYAAYASEGGVGMMKRSTDGGQTWQDVTPKNAPDNELRAAVLMMFVPGSVGRPDDGGLYMTNSQGAWFLPLESDDWQFHASQGNSDPQTQYYPTALFVDTAYTAEYDKPGPVLYEARSRFTDQGPEGLGVFRSTDLGATWQQIGDDLGKRTVTGLALAPHDTAANPAMVETLLATTSDGVWAIPMPPPFR